MRALQLEAPRVSLGSGPTPVRELTGLGPDRGEAPMWIKDDGAYSPIGGNKARKLEWLLGEARRRGSRRLITGGALGTNHGLSTALAARELGMRAILILVPQPEDDHVRRQLERMRAAGAELRFANSVAGAFMRAALLLARPAGWPPRFPYLILPGGSTPRGCTGYVEAALELAGQVDRGELPEPSHIVVPLGSGGTAAGLLVGLALAGLRSRLVGVLVNDLTRVNERTVARLARRTHRFLRRHAESIPEVELSAASLALERDWLGPGYGHSTLEAERAIALLRDREGVELEPVYTAKAVAAALELNRRGSFGPGPVLYWHTYRAPA